MRTDSEYIKNLVNKGKTVITEATKLTPSFKVADGPLLGNGDFGVAIRSEEDGFVYLLGKNDFWRQTHVLETKEQREERLLNCNVRRTGTRILPAGWFRIRLEGVKQKQYYMEQSPYEGCVNCKVSNEGGTIRFRSWIFALQNILFIEIENKTKKEVCIDVALMPGEYQAYEVDGYEDGCHQNAVWFTYAAQPQNVPGIRHIASAAVSDGNVAWEPERFTEKGGKMILREGDCANFAVTLFSDLDAGDPKEKALREASEALQYVDMIWRRHQDWWKGFWERSYVETGDDILDSFYYSSLYLLGSCTREGKVPPALFGCWTTSNLARWSGAYTINYNYESPFFCLYTANRQDLIKSYIDPLLEIIPIGELYAKKLFHKRGICLPVEIGPWGTVCSPMFFHQKTNAAYCCVNIFMHFFSDLDLEWGKRAYPFVRKTVEFWEDDLVYENDIYNVIGDSAHEEYSTACGEKNNTHAVGLLRMLFSGILKMSEELNVDSEYRGRWKNILEHLPEFPVFFRNGQRVYRYNEESYAWRDSNGTPVKFIYPFGCIGLDSKPEEIEIARNTLKQKEYLADNMNSFCEYASMRARVDCEAEKTYEFLIEACRNRSYPNHHIFHGGGGIENLNGIPGSINEMLMQSYNGKIRVFPSWPEKRDASFVKLRAYGAFLVSAEKRAGIVHQVEILSEKGRKLCFVSPWIQTKILKNDKFMEIKKESEIRLDTDCGDVFLFQNAEE